jgi:Acetyltransferase (GNAT) family
VARSLPVVTRRAAVGQGGTSHDSPHDERLAGFAIMLFGEDRAHLSPLAVGLKYEEQGVGRRRLHWLTESALAAGISTIHLELREHRRAPSSSFASIP